MNMSEPNLSNTSTIASGVSNDLSSASRSEDSRHVMPTIVGFPSSRTLNATSNRIHSSMSFLNSNNGSGAHQAVLQLPTLPGVVFPFGSHSNNETRNVRNDLAESAAISSVFGPAILQMNSQLANHQIDTNQELNCTIPTSVPQTLSTELNEADETYQEDDTLSGLPTAITRRGVILAGKYKVVSVVAEGTFSRTVCAQNINTLDLVALKISKQQGHNVSVQEAKRLMLCNQYDPDDVCHIVRFVETIHHQSYFCLVLEVLGMSLLTLVERHGASRLRVVRKMAMQLMVAIRFVHSLDMIHADVKLENVVLQRRGEGESDTASSRIKLVDFGHAIERSERGAYLDTFEIQSLLYRAPEVLLGCPFDQAIDMWGIGCVLLELALGRALFSAHSKNGLCEQMRQLLGPFPMHVYRDAKFYKQLFTDPSCVTRQSNHSDLLQQRYNGIDRLIRTHYRQQGTPLREAEHHLFVQFTASLLDYDPATRMKAHDTFFHPFLQELFPFKQLMMTVTVGRPPSRNEEESNEHTITTMTTHNNNNNNNTISATVATDTSTSTSSSSARSTSESASSAVGRVQLPESDIGRGFMATHSSVAHAVQCPKLPANFGTPLLQQLQATRNPGILGNVQHANARNLTMSAAATESNRSMMMSMANNAHAHSFASHSNGMTDSMCGASQLAQHRVVHTRMSASECNASVGALRQSLSVHAPHQAQQQQQQQQQLMYQPTAVTGQQAQHTIRHSHECNLRQHLHRPRALTAMSSVSHDHRYSHMQQQQQQQQQQQYEQQWQRQRNQFHLHGNGVAYQQAPQERAVTGNVPFLMSSSRNQLQPTNQFCLAPDMRSQNVAAMSASHSRKRNTMSSLFSNDLTQPAFKKPKH